MSTTKTEVLTLVQMLCYNLADQDEIDRLYDEVFRELCHDQRLWTAVFASTPVGTVADPSDQALTELPATLNLVRLIAAFHDGRQLSPTTQPELEASLRDWRDAEGSPTSFTVEGEDDRFLRLYPKRLAGTGTANVLFTQPRTTVSDLLAFPLTLNVLAREFSRESNHRDMPFAEACQKLGNRLLDMIA